MSNFEYVFKQFTYHDNTTDTFDNMSMYVCLYAMHVNCEQRGSMAGWHKCSIMLCFFFPNTFKWMNEITLEISRGSLLCCSRCFAFYGRENFCTYIYAFCHFWHFTSLHYTFHMRQLSYRFRRVPHEKLFDILKANFCYSKRIKTFCINFYLSPDSIKTA